ncbi:MAG: hypothetical protein COX62_00890 [Deltaproteobacteria bacterium CG_4_10_14_0_2_um_filter_43_8]|nr:MAG: hypothetical protein COV43_06855 [Deltaproteobacteria bacterium CG11_big_fil_rev_8_21_14_0_20_42_23]PJA22010.1 MAG: hypothetical protein COX62_00890 [Deltaproteobacteria bacterium CG_4_10_14_0_2_um_filter_43_8]PJC65235.1 MAG: hypothetical protein CO021_00160 [Deltaproteobacteria bacterium CG_4_9_14_0_2_um_filter_42_21]
MFWFKSKKKKQEEDTWNLHDFVNDVDNTMQQQANESPRLQHVHAKLDPKWKNINELVMKAIATTDDDHFTLLCSDLLKHNDLALRAALEIGRSLYHTKNKPEKD